MKYLLSILLCLPFALHAQTIEQSFSNVTDISLTTGSGNCEIRKASGNSVSLKLEHSFGDEYQPSIRQDGNRLVVKDGPHKGSGKQKYILMVPDGTELKLTTGSGNVTVEGLMLELKGTTGSGNLTIKNSRGEISINNGSGDLEVADFEGELSMNVGSGDASLSDYKGELKINCGSGDVTAEGIEALVKINAGSGNIELDNASFTDKSSLNAGSGNVSVSLSNALAHDLSINTGSGKGTLDMNGKAFKGTLVLEADKKKGEIDAPFTFDSTEEIEENNQVKIRKTVKLGNENIKVKISTGSGVAAVEE